MKNLFTLFVVLFIASYTFAQTAGNLTVTVTTSETGGNYAPKNVVAIWIEDDAGNFVKTLMAYAQNRKTHLNNWQESTSNAGSEYNVVDAITGATRSGHDTRSCSWDGTDVSGNIVTDGTYTINFELTDKNSTGNFSEMTIIKGLGPDSIVPTTVPSFADVTVNWIPEPNAINDVISEDEVSFYPNPTTGQIIIDKEDNVLVTIISVAGDIIYEGYDKDLDLRKQAAGIYIIKLSTKEKVRFGKIFKE